MEPLARIEVLLQANWIAVYTSLFVILAGAEFALGPGRSDDGRGLPRFATNFGLQIGQSLVMMALPLGMAGIVVMASDTGPGLLRHPGVPPWFVLPALLLARTLAVYWFHRLEHGWPLLWRYHRVHHSDPEMDLTTALRQHPVATLPTLATQGALLYVLAPPLWAFLLSDAIILANQFWHHANVERRPAVAGAIGLVFMTPEIHRVHHSAARHQTDSNFSVLFSFWDRLFGTYMPPEGAGHFRIGLGDAEDGIAANFLRQLWVPFGRQTGVPPDLGGAATGPAKP